MDAGADEARDSRDQDGARLRMRSKRLDQKGVLFEKLCRHKNKDWAIVSQFALGETKSMQCAVVERGNAQLVKETLPDFLAAAETFQRSSSRLFVESSG